MILAALTVIQLFCDISSESGWLEKSSKRVDENAIQWVKQMLKEDQELEKLRGSVKENLQTNSKKCLTSAEPIALEANIPIYVMMSFSVKEETWVSLSKEMENIGAVFVLRGLPNNSFKELSKKIQDLNSLGVKAQIQIDPNLFTTYQVEKVPTFLIVKKDKHEKISGNISLAYAIEKMGGIK